jgi:anti-sigma B factor antagonist
MPELVSLRTSETNDATYLHVAGVLDVATALGVEDAAFAAMQTPRSTLVVDLSELTSCDSTGIHALASISRGTRRSGVRLLVVSPPATVLRTIDVAGLAHMFEWIFRVPTEPDGNGRTGDGHAGNGRAADGRAGQDSNLRPRD